jgi:hypothetical protein
VRAGFISLAGYLKVAEQLLGDDDVRDLENKLLENPKTGSLIAGANGARKLRIPLQGRGKRGGGRVIYWHDEATHRFYLLLVYAKSAKSDLSADEVSRIAAMIAQIKKD